MWGGIILPIITNYRGPSLRFLHEGKFQTTLDNVRGLFGLMSTTQGIMTTEQSVPLRISKAGAFDESPNGSPGDLAGNGVVAPY